MTGTRFPTLLVVVGITVASILFSLALVILFAPLLDVTVTRAVVAFVIVMLGALELALLGYVISPEKTQAVLKPVHDWSAANRQQILITLLLVIGIWQLVKGFAIL